MKFLFNLCKHRTRCGHYDDTSRACTYNEGIDYCGIWKELEYGPVKNKAEHKSMNIREVLKTYV